MPATICSYIRTDTRSCIAETINQNTKMSSIYNWDASDWSALQTAEITVTNSDPTGQELVHSISDCQIRRIRLVFDYSLTAAIASVPDIVPSIVFSIAEVNSGHFLYGGKVSILDATSGYETVDIDFSAPMIPEASIMLVAKWIPSKSTTFSSVVCHSTSFGRTGKLMPVVT